MALAVICELIEEEHISAVLPLVEDRLAHSKYGWIFLVHRIQGSNRDALNILLAARVLGKKPLLVFSAWLTNRGNLFYTLCQSWWDCWPIPIQASWWPLCSLSCRSSRYASLCTPGVPWTYYHAPFDFLFALQADPEKYKHLLPSLIQVQEMIVHRKLPKDMNYHAVPAPWCQILVLKLFSLFGKDDER